MKRRTRILGVVISRVKPGRKQNALSNDLHGRDGRKAHRRISMTPENTFVEKASSFAVPFLHHTGVARVHDHLCLRNKLVHLLLLLDVHGFALLLISVGTNIFHGRRG